MRHLRTPREFFTLMEQKDSNPLSDLGGEIIKDATRKVFGLGSEEDEDVIYNPYYSWDLDPTKAEFPASADAKKVYAEVEKAMDRHGITNKDARLAIQACIGKESNWTKLAETPYSNTPNQRIREVFGKRVSSLNDEELDKVKKTEGFWDVVYGKRMGNDQPGDGAKYRGRGVNGLTGKDNYERFNKLLQESNKLGRSVNIVTNPEELSKPDVAAEVAILFFLEAFKTSEMQSKYGVSDINKLPDLETAVKAIINANYGIAGNYNSTSVGREGLSKALATAKNLKSKGGMV
jgi:predicted chitinase